MASVAVRKTERSAAAVLAGWMRRIIEDERLDLGPPDVEAAATDGKLPDIVIYATGRSRSALCPIECKLPAADADDEGLKEAARLKAVSRQAPFFATTNFRKLYWYSTEKAGRPTPPFEHILDIFDLADIADIDLLEETRFAAPAQRRLADFLRALVDVRSGRKPERPPAPDQIMVRGLRELVDRLGARLHSVIAERAHKDAAFREQLARWFHEQAWSFTGGEDDFARAARQAAFLLANKVLFYHVLQARRPRDLDPLQVPDGISRGGLLRRLLDAFFSEVVKRIDYETIYDADFIDDVAFPDDRDAVDAVVRLVRFLRRYDPGKLGYDVIGPIFEQLVPPDDRHVLGQYFTPSTVVDLILRFAVRHETDVVLDPACGAGTFLVRAYHLKRILNPRLEHHRILDGLWGADIAKFPAHLSTINLVLGDLA
ncbi:MAG: N-6 DNA methylase, partial [Myxococcota bacterium]|nr:N-6 DNA methylase [Myxococcota bacterium]